MCSGRGTDRTAIVTGAAGGIGAATARHLLRQGRRVALIDRNQDGLRSLAAELSDDAGRIAVIAVDVTEETAVVDAVAQVADLLGPPLVLVNNAGWGSPAPATEMDSQHWDDVLGVNLRAPFLFAREAGRHMVREGWGRIVNMSSIAALGDPERVHYASAKAGLIGLTKTLALELGPAGITANAVAPGFTVSAMTAATAARAGRSFQEHQRLAAQDIPVRRVGAPDDIARAVAFFTSDDAGFVSGQVLQVAGGPVG